MKSILLLSLILCIMGCKKPVDPQEPITPDLNEVVIKEDKSFALHFSTEDWKLVPQQGIDSYIGYYGNGTDKISFDHGKFNTPINKNKVPDLLYYEETTINGNKAVIAKEKESTGILLRAIIYSKDKINSTALYALNPTNEQEIITIFKTHRFK